jgi:diketogulonate reductase-like aldo/keto reductase
MTVGQVALRWGLQMMSDKGIVIPRSHNVTHMHENVKVLAFKLDDTDMAALQNLPQSKIYNTQCQPWC